MEVGEIQPCIFKKTRVIAVFGKIYCADVPTPPMDGNDVCSVVEHRGPSVSRERKTDE